MGVKIDIQRVTKAADNELPDNATLRRWSRKALSGRVENATFCIRIVDQDEITELNSNYRQKNNATNVLSFPMEMEDEEGRQWLGDVVICAKIVNREAMEQGKTPEAHWAHMVVHGVLHLLGYDHILEDEAEIMEDLETQILTSLAYPAPYQSNSL